MIIRGFLKTTLLDYPEHIAATIFLGGCNMRCVFCHNMDIVECSEYMNVSKCGVDVKNVKSAADTDIAKIDMETNNVECASYMDIDKSGKYTDIVKTDKETKIVESSTDIDNVKCSADMNIAYDIALNENIVEHAAIPESYTCEEIFNHLKKRKGILDGVCITGGEPTLYPELPEFIEKIKALGFLVKLDTNGTNPEMLKLLIDEKLVDYVAMDIKSSFDKYNEICGRKCDLSAIERSIGILIKSGAEHALDYEFRTTIIEEYHDIEEIQKIAQMIKGADKYYLQSFVDSDFVPDHSLHSVNASTLDEYIEILKPHVKNVQARGL